MIYLITGTPGAGKTLYAVSTLVQKLAAEKIEKNGQQIHRRVVVDGIPNLLLPHELMAAGVKDDEDNLLPGDGDGLWNWPDWCQPGDVIVVDEIQRWWRPRGMGTKPPREVKALETHRHKGVDFVIVTQNPMMLDQNVRRLVGRHQHVRRLLGMKRAIIYDWDGCSNTLSPKSATGTSFFNYPKSAYALYKSSELHTKPTQKIPLWVVVPILAVVGGLFIAPKAFSVLGGAMTGKGVNGPAAVASAPKLDLGVGAPVPLPGVSAPAVAGSAPVLSTVASNDVAGCISVAGRCGCFNEKGKRVPSEPLACLEGAGINGVSKAVVAEDAPPVHIASLETLEFVKEQKRRGAVSDRPVAYALR